MLSYFKNPNLFFLYLELNNADDVSNTPIRYASFGEYINKDNVLDIFGGKNALINENEGYIVIHNLDDRRIYIIKKKELGPGAG